MKNPFIETAYAIAYREIQNEEDLIFKSSAKKEFTLIPTSWRYWYADPIVFSNGGKDWLFAEKMDKIKRRGCLSVCEIKSGKFGEFTDVLCEPYHLSYPFVFEKGGGIYMIPELTSNKCLDLYVATEFPYKWKKKATLFENVLFADTNVIEANGRWYLITGEMDPEIGSKTKTLLFDADHIETGNLSLISEDTDFVFDERGAGDCFFYHNRLIRPTQGGDEENYGVYLKFSELAFEKGKMNTSEIAKVDVNQVEVQGKERLSGTHTYAKCGGIEIIDVKFTETSKLPVIIIKAFGKIKRLLHK